MIAALLAAGALAAAPNLTSRGPCGAPKPPSARSEPGGVHVHTSERRVFRSPSCHWRVSLRAAPNDPDENALMEVTGGGKAKPRLNFKLVRDAYLYWSADERFLVVQNLPGANGAEVLIFDLQHPTQKPRALQGWINQEVGRQLPARHEVMWSLTRVRRMTADRIWLVTDLAYAPASGGSGLDRCLYYDGVPLAGPFAPKARITTPPADKSCPD